MGQVVFKNYQKAALEELDSGRILCGGVGTGKSITSLGYFYICECKGVVWDDGRLGPMLEPKDLYIITTAKKRDDGDWVRECERFEISDGNPIRIVVDSWNNIRKYEDVHSAFFIFDEQRVVGSGSWSKTFIRIARNNRWILLSATPGDVWTDYIPVFVANGFYKNRTQFLRRHAVYSRYCTRYPKIEKFVETGHLEKLRRMITVTMRCEKETKPHWIDEIVEYDKELYLKIQNERWDPWKNEPVQDASGACYLMRRAVNENEARVRKLYWLAESIHSKMIVFYNFDYELEAIKKAFEDSDEIEIAEWNGHRHEPIPKADRWLYLVQYMAGAEGWNCIETDTIVFFSQSYSYKLMTQAAGRIDRMNTPFVDLYYYVFKTEAPIDKAISRALRGKKNFNEKLFIHFLK